MPKSFLTGIDLNKNELLNVQIQNLTQDPDNPKLGQIYYNSVSNKLRVCVDDGTQSGHTVQWQNVGSDSGMAFGYVKVGDTTIAADTASDTLELTAGSNITLVPDSSNDKVTIAATNTDTKVTQTATTTDASYPLLFTNAANKTTSSADTARFATSIKANASSGNILANKFNGLSVDTETNVFMLSNGTASLTVNAADYTLGAACEKGVATSVTSGNSNLITSGAVYNAINALPTPMQYKGTLGTDGTTTTLPTAAAGNNGWAYIVVNAGTYAGTPAMVGDMFISNGSVWTLVPSGDEAVPVQIQRQTFTIAQNASTGSVNIGQNMTIFAVTAIQNNSGVIADWTYSGSTVTVTLASAATAAVTVNILYYGGGTVPTKAAMVDYIVDEGFATAGQTTWHYRKWDSGIAECWATKPEDANVNQTWGNVYENYAVLSYSFPSGLFNATPEYFNYSWNGTRILSIEVGGGLSSTKTPDMKFVRATEGQISGNLLMHAKGTWK